MEIEDAIFRFQVGAWSCVSLCDGGTTFAAAEFFPDSSADDRRAALSAFGAPRDALPVSINLLVATSPTARVLVDTGVGRDVGNGEGRLPSLLAAAGIRPESIDVVIITHGHWDHIGGLTDGAGRLRFPGARHVMPAVEWAFWTDPVALDGLPAPLSEWARTHLPPLAGRIECIGPDAVIVPGVRAVPAPGHTAGHTGLLFESDEERLLHVADAFHHPLQLTRPAWLVSVDMAPEQAAATRRDLLRRSARAATRLFGYHFPFPGLVTQAGIFQQFEMWNHE